MVCNRKIQESAKWEEIEESERELYEEGKNKIKYLVKEMSVRQCVCMRFGICVHKRE